MRSYRAPGWTVPALLVGAFAVFSLAWTWGNPLGAAPDELDHYTRALAAGHGQLVGSTAGAGTLVGGQRVFTVPAGLASPAQFACDAFNGDLPATCSDAPGNPPSATQVVSAAGLYLPTAYLVPGLVMRLSHDPYSALRVGRLGSALLSLSLLAVAVAVLWSRRRSALALAGVVLAVTPMQLFLLTEVGPNGLELAAAICYAAALLALARPEEPSRWTWAALAFAGVVLAATRPLGPEWVVAGVLVVLCLRGPRAALARLRGSPSVALAAGAVIAAAAVANLAWQARNQGASPVALGSVLGHLKDTLHHLPTQLYQAIGVFGWLDTPLPVWACDLWVAAIAGLAATALLVGTRRQRVVLGATAVAVVVVSTVLTSYLSLALGYGGSGVGVQGRYLMPFAIWLPLLSADVIVLQRHRLRAWAARSVPLAVCVFAALFQLYAWYFNERRYAVGIHGPVNLLVPGAWTPPGGWPLWFAVAAAATAMLAGSGVAGLLAHDQNPNTSTIASTEPVLL